MALAKFVEDIEERRIENMTYASYRYSYHMVTDERPHQHTPQKATFSEKTAMRAMDDILFTRPKKKFSTIRICCRDCGREFEFTAGEQAYYAKRDFSNPVRCKECREFNKYKRMLMDWR